MTRNIRVDRSAAGLVNAGARALGWLFGVVMHGAVVYVIVSSWKNMNVLRLMVFLKTYWTGRRIRPFSQRRYAADGQSVQPLYHTAQACYINPPFMIYCVPSALPRYRLCLSSVRIPICL
jgi:hypothetical protein